jgi:glycopeptide antibiotics resistance protein
VLKFNVKFSYLENIRRINLIPFRQITNLNGKFDYGEIILNVMIFVPLGMYAGVLYKRWNIWKKLLLCFLISLICEGYQYIMAVGTSDITDIINNTLGGTIGLMIYNVIEKAFKNSAKSQKFINLIAVTGTVVMISFLLMLKIKRLWIFRM